MQEFQKAKVCILEMEAELIERKQVAETATAKGAEMTTVMAGMKRDLSLFQKENRQVKTE